MPAPSDFAVLRGRYPVLQILLQLLFCSLFLTLPVSVASAERTFSKLKLIKSYLRSTMGQERLKNLVFISIERVRAKKIEAKDMVQKLRLQKKKEILLTLRL